MTSHHNTSHRIVCIIVRSPNNHHPLWKRGRKHRLGLLLVVATISSNIKYIYNKCIQIYITAPCRPIAKWRRVARHKSHYLHIRTIHVIRPGKYSTICRIRTAKADQIFATTTKCCTGQGNERLHLVLDTQIYMYLYLYIFIDI